MNASVGLKKRSRRRHSKKKSSAAETAHTEEDDDLFQVNIVDAKEDDNKDDDDEDSETDVQEREIKQPFSSNPEVSKTQQQDSNEDNAEDEDEDDENESDDEHSEEEEGDDDNEPPTKKTKLFDDDDDDDDADDNNNEENEDEDEKKDYVEDDNEESEEANEYQEEQEQEQTENNTEHQKRDVYDPNKTVFVGNLNKKTTEENVNALFSSCGFIKRINFLRYSDTHKFQGACFVEFEDTNGAKRALKMDGTEFLGVNIKVNKGGEKPKKTYRKGAVKKADDSATIYVGNLSFGTDEQTLRKFFSQYGKIVRVNLPIWHSTGRRRSFAMVEFATAASAANSVAASGQTIDGREVVVTLYHGREEGAKGAWKGNKVKYVPKKFLKRPQYRGQNQQQ